MYPSGGDEIGMGQDGDKTSFANDAINSWHLRCHAVSKEITCQDIFLFVIQIPVIFIDGITVF